MEKVVCEVAAEDEYSGIGGCEVEELWVIGLTIVLKHRVLLIQMCICPRHVHFCVQANETIVLKVNAQ